MGEVFRYGGWTLEEWDAYQKTLGNLARTQAHPKDSILLEADKIVNGERKSDYGPSESFEKMARTHNSLWETDLKGSDFIKMLMTVKLVRESFKHKRDNLVDLVGYAELLNRLT